MASKSSSASVISFNEFPKFTVEKLETIFEIINNQNKKIEHLIGLIYNLQEEIKELKELKNKPAKEPTIDQYLSDYETSEYETDEENENEKNKIDKSYDDYESDFSSDNEECSETKKEPVSNDLDLDPNSEDEQKIKILFNQLSNKNYIEEDKHLIIREIIRMKIDCINRKEDKKEKLCIWTSLCSYFQNDEFKRFVLTFPDFNKVLKEKMIEIYSSYTHRETYRIYRKLFNERISISQK